MRYVIAVFGLAGIVMASLTLAERYAAPVAFAAVLRSGSDWSSAYVAQSPYAEIYGLPVAVMGIAGYALLIALALLRQRTLTVYASGIGLGFELYLTNIQAHLLHVWCAYCISSLILMIFITFFAFGELIFATASDTGE